MKSLEEYTKKIDELELESKNAGLQAMVSDLSTKLAATSAVCMRYETISIDLCRDNSKLKQELKSCSEEINKNW